jgi:hypothetical protein
MQALYQWQASFDPLLRKYEQAKAKTLTKTTAHELTLPVFYRESLARIVALERFRNLIETNIKAGITLYTDHKPALFENSLSNKGQLSAWNIAEVADLLPIVENLYRQGGEMLFADPLSRVCAPTEGWYDPSIPRKLAVLFEHLPQEVRNNEHMRVYAGKDTYAAGRLVQKWRKPTNRISQGRLLTKETAATAFHIGIDDANKCVNETIQLINNRKHFAILMPISLTSEIARLENVDGQRVHDIETAKKIASMSKIVLASGSETWLVSCPEPTFNHFYNNDMERLGMDKVQEIFHNNAIQKLILLRSCMSFWRRYYAAAIEQEYKLKLESLSSEFLRWCFTTIPSLRKEQNRRKQTSAPLST